jgi:hypothetical protein
VKHDALFRFYKRRFDLFAVSAVACKTGGVRTIELLANDFMLTTIIVLTTEITSE